jgi:ABC-type polysaccharide/polyol phosphate export permease
MNKKISFWSDLRQSWKMMPVAFYFAWSDTKARYKRSFLGPFWIVLATLVGVVGLGVVWSVIFNQSLKDILPSITLGLVFWYFISGCITEASNVFIMNASSIKGYPNPYLIFVFKHIIKHLIFFLHNMLIIIFVSVYFGVTRSLFEYSLFLAGMSLVVLNLFWMSALLAMINVRFRDMELMVSSAMPILFFISPVIFKPQQVQPIQHLMYLNPFASLLRVVRDPLYSEVVSYSPFWACLVMLGMGMIITPIVYKKLIREVPYLL